ncbi:cardiolipin synthase [Gynurincola endophyticus]|uniref:cardiolipin synthase n=1 Tax=Gynurincola endophyticus TaxID=2479004 RepID=UPI000F8C7D4F|nr:cardiolipin synthase [Gynurincola endophyticus]
MQANLITILSIIYGLAVFATCLKIIWDTQSNTKALAYLLFTVFVPFAGMIFYFFFGNNIRRNKMYSKKLIKDNNTYSQLQRTMISEANKIYASGHPIIKKNKELARLLLYDKSPLATGNKVNLLRNGEEKFKYLFHDLENAKETIHIEYYIWEDDPITVALKELLIRKAGEGVKIRIVYDDWGSKAIRKRYVRELRSAGIEAFPFNEVRFIALANRVNYRNHRKIVIIDGYIAYVGGINLSDRYINHPGTKKLYWRDTHIRIEGTGVNYLQYLFLCDFNFCAKQNVELKRSYFCLPDTNDREGAIVQIAASGPDSDVPTIMFSILQMVNLATKEILITTPYMIPNEGTLDALRVQSLSGVDVKLLLPMDSDSKLVNYCSRSYYTELMKAGIKIYLYKKGFIHAKTMVVDGIVANVGTANLDMRSFDMNFEVNAIIYDQKIAGELKLHFQVDLLDAEPLNLKTWRKRPRWQKFVERVARLFSPLL